MTAFPLTKAVPSPADFGIRLRRLERRYISLWAATSSGLAATGPRTGWPRKLSNAWHTRRLIGEIAERIASYPASEVERQRWQDALRARIRDFGEARFGWPSGYRRLLVADDFWESTVQFARWGRDFEPRIASEDLFQALRNLWIINSIQMLLDLEVCCTRAAFAYSMLYPWTDNFLDAPDVSAADKQAFNRRLGNRLRGACPAPSGRHERQVFDLVGMIERALPRDAHPNLYRSLQAIHRGQNDSLEQQVAAAETIDLLAVTVRKGGSSLLPDAYLVAPGLATDEESFLFGYGVFLQLLDDLQDVAEDLEAGHRTLFTVAARQGALDPLAARLYNFIDRCLEHGEAFSAPSYRDRKDLIRRNCRSLLVTAVAEQPRFFSRRFIRHLEGSWPLGFASMRHLRRFAERRFSAVGDRLRAQRGAGSLIELLCSEASRSANASISRP